jgi:hypothetical protein
MQWFLMSNDLNNPVYAAYVAWTAFEVLAAFALAVTLVKPRWRDSLGTGLWAFILILGTFGWLKLVFVGLLELASWSPTGAAVVLLAIGLALSGAIIVRIVRWLGRRLHEPRPAHRISGDIAYFGTFAIGMLAVFEWMDFHVRSKSAFFGVNPRCIDYSSGYCFKLDTTNLPWDAVAAVWLYRGIMLFGLGALFIGVVAIPLFLIHECRRIVRTRRSARERGA